MNHSDSLAKLAPALLKAQLDIRNAIKDSTNPHFGNDFASLTSVIAAVKPALNAHGIAVVQVPGFADGVATLETTLLHTSGEWMAGTSASPVTKKDPQGVGSAITYLRRYSLAAIGCIGQEDDDGNDAASPDPLEAKVKAAKAELRQLAEANADTLDDATKAIIKKAFSGTDLDALIAAKEAACTFLQEQSA